MFALGVSFLYGLGVAAVDRGAARARRLAHAAAGAADVLRPAGRRSRAGSRAALRRRRERGARGPGFWARWIGVIQRHPVDRRDRGDVADARCSQRLRSALRLGNSDAGNNPPRFTSRAPTTCSRRASGRASTGRSRSSPSCRRAGDAGDSTRLTAAAASRRRASRRWRAPRLNPDRRRPPSITVYPRSSPQSSETTGSSSTCATTCSRRSPRRRGSSDLRRRADRDRRSTSRACSRASSGSSSASSSRCRRCCSLVVFRSLVDPAAGGRDEPALDRRGARGHRRRLPVRLVPRASSQRARSRRSCRC